MASYKYTYYQVLGLQPAVSSLEIKRAYRRLVKTLHPDVEHSGLNATERIKSNERMAKLNEAYETLKDKSKRAAYDSLIGVNNRGKSKNIQLPIDSEQVRQEYLQQIFYPARQKITRVLSKYKKELTRLSEDIYDQALVEKFENYIQEIELVLSQASNTLSKRGAPHSLSAAELMMRYAIAQAVDGLEELQRFCGNYDYNHLTMAGNLFRESTDLSKQALYLTKH